MPYAYVKTHNATPRRNRAINAPYGELRWAPVGIQLAGNAHEAIKAQRVTLQKSIRAGKWVDTAVKVANDLEDSGHTRAADAVTMLDAPDFRSYESLYRALESAIGPALVGDAASDLRIAFDRAR